MPTWLVRVMPYLEQDAAYAGWDLTMSFPNHPAAAREHVVPAFLCPSRRGADQAVAPPSPGPPIILPCGCTFTGRRLPGGAVTDYAGNHGDLSPGSSGLPTDFYWGGYGTGTIISARGVYKPDGTVTADWLDKVRLANVTDGASNTVLVGEMHVPRGKLAVAPDNAPAYDGGRFYHMSRVGGPGVPIAAGPDDDVSGMGLYAFGSWHPGVCHFAFADGRAGAVKNTVSTQILERLLNRADGEVVPEF